MPKFGWLFVTAFLAAMVVHAMASAVPAHAKEAKSLQVMFLDGAALQAAPNNASETLDTLECGVILPWQERQEGQWFLVKSGALDGWVNGHLTTFDTSGTDYCHRSAPPEVLIKAGLLVPPAETSTAAVLPPAPTGGGYGSIEDIICQAAINYGQNCQAMINVAACESTFDPYAVGGLGEMGLFQFLPGTWSTTPYASQDPFDPVANANAAAWMWSVGRRGEWYC